VVTIQEITTFEKILIAIRELEAWEERKQKVRFELKNSNGADRTELNPKLEKINQQIQYYDLLVKDMKKEVKPSNLPDILNTLVSSR
jgi:hypothetical protein